MLVYRTGVACFCVRNLPRSKKTGRCRDSGPFWEAWPSTATAGLCNLTSCLRGAFAIQTLSGGWRPRRPSRSAMHRSERTRLQAPKHHGSASIPVATWDCRLKRSRGSGRVFRAPACRAVLRYSSLAPNRLRLSQPSKANISHCQCPGRRRRFPLFTGLARMERSSVAIKNPPSSGL